MNQMFWRSVFTGGLIAGILDLSAALILLGLRGMNPVQVLHSIASGMLGMAAYESGVLSAVLGLFCHFLIATGAAFVYCFARINTALFPESPIVTGLLYGIAVYFFMNFIVLPLSAFPHQIRYTPRGMLIIMFCVGLPIAIVGRHLAPMRMRSFS